MKPRFSPTICVTHLCNLDCVYCYQKHEPNMRMHFDTAKQCIDWIFNNIPSDMEGVEIGFIGGESLLEFELIKKIVEYTCKNYGGNDYIFYATANGTVLTAEMKDWFRLHKNCFVLGLSLDGTPDTHNKNRCDSYEKIDFDFFTSTWPEQGVKMTLSAYSLEHLADNIKHIYSLGFKEIGGVNLFEGEFDWGKEEFIEMLIPQLAELVEYYVENDTLKVDQMLNRKVMLCEATRKNPRKWCGIGTGAVFFDIDGTRRPCPFCTPMTFSADTLEEICEYDFNNVGDFVDDYCFNECYIYPICPHCAGANYLTQGTFKVRDKSKCMIQKLITIFAADLEAKRMLRNPERYDEQTLFHSINVIEKIKTNLLPEFNKYYSNM